MSKIFQMGGFDNTSSQITVSGTNLDVLTYKNNGSLLLFQNATNVDIFMIGGGGEGGTNCGAGGGAGAAIIALNQTLPAGAYTITVGAGGSGSVGGDSTGNTGGDTSIGSLFIAKGGGGGGGNERIGNAGGCSGGTGGNNSSTAPNPVATNVVNGVSGIGPSTTSTYAVVGNKGGNGVLWSSGNYQTIKGAGGGGIGAVGTNATTSTPGTGGDGIYQITIGGTTYNLKDHFSPNTSFGVNDGSGNFYIGGGGGAGGFGSAINVSGGKGGGGVGRDDGSSTTGANGVANTGSGGGGGGANTASNNSSDGGSGIVIIRFNNSTSLTIPSLQSSGAISFSDLKRIFEDTNTSVVFSRYYNNHSSAIAYGCGSPNTGNSISLSQMYNKSKEYLRPGVSPLTFTDKTGTTQINYRNYTFSATQNTGNLIGDYEATNSGSGGGFAIIPTGGLVFNWYGTNYGNSSSTNSDSKIYWSADNVLGFGTWYKYELAEYVGFLIGGYFQRYGKEIHASPSVVINKNHAYVRIIISSVYSYEKAQEGFFDGGSFTDMIKLNIRLIRGPKYQYIELKVNEIRDTIRTGAYRGRTSFRTTTSEINIFGNYNWPVLVDNSIVLRSDLEGNTWEVYNANHYVDV